MYTLLIVKMFNSLGVIKRWPLANYVSSMHLPDTSDCITLSPSSASSHLHCSVAHTNISSFELYYAFIYCCDEKIKIRTAGICELKGIRYYIDYSQASLTTMETSARMLCVILAYGVHWLVAIQAFYIHVYLFVY